MGMYNMHDCNFNVPAWDKKILKYNKMGNIKMKIEGENRDLKRITLCGVSYTSLIWDLYHNYNEKKGRNFRGKKVGGNLQKACST